MKMRKRKKILSVISSISGVLAICGLFCCSCLGSDKKPLVAIADVSQDLLIDRYYRGNVGYRVTSQIDSNYSVWGGDSVDFRWYYNGLNGYYISYSQPFYTNDEYNIVNKGIYYDSSWYFCSRNTDGDKRYLGGFYIDYQLSNDANILFNPISLSSAGSTLSGDYEYLANGFYSNNLDTFGSHNGEGIYWESPYKFVYCYLTKLNYVSMSGAYAVYEMEYTYTMSRDDGSVYVFTDTFLFNGLKVNVRFWNYQEYNLDNQIVHRNPYGEAIYNYSNYDKISFNGSILLWSHEFDLADLPPSYADGYNTGYEDGYDAGYDAGRELNQQAYDTGYYEGQQSVLNQLDDSYNSGFSDGFNQGFVDSGQVTTIFSGILQVAMVPINFFLAIFNFEILGINISAFISALLTVAVTIIIVRLVIGSGGGSDG